MAGQDLAEIVKEYKGGKQSFAGKVEAALKKIKASKDYNAVIEVNPNAVAQAKAAPRGRLYGTTFIAKDNFLTASTHTTAASNILKGFKAPYESTAAARLQAEGAVLLGKSNLDAFAHGSSTENSDFGPTKNPHDNTRVPGGSSGGSAAAVALDLADFALGTDTGGSIRLPASFCGVVGLKPTYGLVSRYGVIAMASSTDVIGPLTKSVEDAAYVLDVMAGPDGFDGTMVPRAKDYTKLSGTVTGKKFGLVTEHMGKGVEPGVKQVINGVVDKLKAAGAEVEEVSIPMDELALAVYYVLVPAEVSSNLARYDGVKYGYSAKEAKNLRDTYKLSRGQGFNAENKRRIMIGTFVLSSGYYDAYYHRAQAVRTKLIEEYNQALGKYDGLIGPTAASTAFKIGAKAEPLSMYLTDIMTVGANLVGNPAISLPVGQTKGLPVGLQLMAPQRAEKNLLDMAQGVMKLVEGGND